MFNEKDVIVQESKNVSPDRRVTRQTMPMTAADLFVKALEAEGVEFIFGIPGEENLDLLNALRDSSIKVILTRHEQAAGFMAATYGRLTGRPGVCMSTLGPGATNLVTAAAYAKLGAMPMLMVTGQKPIKTSKQGLFQIIDVVNMFRPLTKYTAQIVSGGRVPFHIREALRLAEEERPGVVHLEFPEDIAREEVDVPVVARSQGRRATADQIAIDDAVDLIEQSQHPLMIIGAGANRKFTAPALRQFVDETGIPFISTQMGKGVVDEQHPLYLGTAALSANDFMHRAIAHADLILCVGHDAIEKPPFFMQPDGPVVIHLDFNSAQVDPVYFPQVEVIGDIADSIRRINQRVMPQPTWDFSYFMMVKTHLDAHLQEGVADPHFPVRPRRLVADMRAVMPADGIVTLDNGIYKLWFARNYPAHMPNTVLLDNALATMGAGLPSAIAARLVYPERKVLAVCGDGGFMMNSQELETAVRLNLDLVIVILRDNALGMIKWKQARLGLEDFGLDYGNPDFAQYANSYGAQGHRLEATEDLLPTLETCLNTPGVHVIDVPVDYSENDQVFNHDIKELSNLL